MILKQADMRRLNHVLSRSEEIIGLLQRYWMYKGSRADIVCEERYKGHRVLTASGEFRPVIISEGGGLINIKINARMLSRPGWLWG